MLKTKEAKNTEVRRGKDLKVKVFSLYYITIWEISVLILPILPLMIQKGTLSAILLANNERVTLILFSSNDSIGVVKSIILLDTPRIFLDSSS